MTRSVGRKQAGRMLGVALSLIALAMASEASAQCCDPKAGSHAKDASAQCTPGSCLTLNISGMTCGDCAPRVEKALGGVKGVKSAKVSYERREATVELGAPAPKAKQFLAAVKRAGFTAQIKPESATAPSKPTGGSMQSPSKS